MTSKNKMIVGIVLSIAGVILLVWGAIKKPDTKSLWMLWSGFVLALSGLGMVITTEGKSNTSENNQSTDSTATQRTKSDCCKDAEGKSCYPCVSVACCGAGFRAGYVENRDIMTRNKKA